MSYTPPPPPPPEYGGGQAAPQQNQKALWSLITGILGILCCGLLGIAALILGNQAKQEIAMSGGMQTGDGMAKAGVILGWIAIALMVVGVIVAITTGAFTGSMGSTAG